MKTWNAPSETISIRYVSLAIKVHSSEKATKVCEVSTLLLSGTTQDKSKVEISKHFVAFSEYMNFN